MEQGARNHVLGLHLERETLGCRTGHSLPRMSYVLVSSDGGCDNFYQFAIKLYNCVLFNEVISQNSD